jgi:hypothetical protein
MRIHGLDDGNPEAWESGLAAGARFVVFEYCISLVVATRRRPSEVYLLRPGELGLIRGLPYTLLTLLLGWWGIPWGLIHTPLALITNLSGGRDVTPAVRDWLHHQASESKA